MPRKSAFKCYFGCIPFKGKLHHFPPQEYPYAEKFDQWKMVLSEIDRERGDNYIYNNIRICDHHFEEFYRTASGRLTKNAVPTLNIASTSTTAETDLLNRTSDNAEANSQGIYQSPASTYSGKMTLRWGIVAAGKISYDFVNAFNSYPEKGDQAIVAVAARDKNRAADFAKIHNIAKVFDSYQALAISSDIDVAYIGALNPDHYVLAKLFLENGKHVLCEKPLCLNEKQAQSLINLAKKKNLFIMEAIWSRFSPAYIDVEKEITAGNLGEIKFLEADFGIFCEADRLFKKEYGGSALLDIGIYLLQLSQYVFKEEPKNIIAVGNLNDSGVDVTGTIILDYGGGRRAVLNTHSRLQLKNSATIYGEKGRITLEDPFHFPIKVTGADGTVKEYPLHKLRLPSNFSDVSAGLVYETLEVARCIRAGLIESPRMSHKESLILAKMMDTIRKQLGVHYDVDDKEY